jgi:deazaflavin-dependent oxidoreductase (nitroreductase family)
MAGRCPAGWGDIDRRRTVHPALSGGAAPGQAEGMASSVGTRIGRWLYPGGHPNRLARVLNRLSVVQVTAGLLPDRVVTLEVPGRTSGRTVSFPLVAVEQDGATYLVAMLGRRTNWVRNVAANGGRAVLRRRRGGPAAVELQEVDPADRAPILKRFLAVAPGARPHIPVDRHAPLAEFARVAPDHPVFRVVKKV